MRHRLLLPSLLAAALLFPSAAFAIEEPIPSAPKATFLTSEQIPYTYDPQVNNLEAWEQVLRHTDGSTPEGTLARVIQTIFTRQTGAGGHYESPQGFAIDPWLTPQGKGAKGALAPFDVSSPWLNTVAVHHIVRSQDGRQVTYYLNGTVRTSAPPVGYFEMTISLVKGDDGPWLADGFQVQFQDQGAIGLKVNGQPVGAGLSPMLVNDRVLVPFRALAEALGATVEYRKDQGQAVVRKDIWEMTFTIGQKTFLTRSTISGGTHDTPLDVAPLLVEDRIFLPARALAEALGAKVEWANETVYVSTGRERIAQEMTADLGQGRPAKLQLVARLNNYDLPYEWMLMADGIPQLEFSAATDDGLYTHAEFTFADVDGDGQKEVLLFRYNAGSGGITGLTVYHPSQGWKILFNPDLSVEGSAKGLSMAYIGDLQVRFEDASTGLKGIIPLSPEHREMGEEMLSRIGPWKDPISGYRFDDDGQGGKAIVAYQRVCGVAHVDTIGHVKTVYHLQDGQYRAVRYLLTDNDDKVLATAEAKAAD